MFASDDDDEDDDDDDVDDNDDNEDDDACQCIKWLSLKYIRVCVR